jgi:hypothetical protein
MKYILFAGAYAGSSTRHNDNSRAGQHLTLSRGTRHDTVHKRGSYGGPYTQRI